MWGPSLLCAIAATFVVLQQACLNKRDHCVCRALLPQRRHHAHDRCQMHHRVLRDAVFHGGHVRLKMPAGWEPVSWSIEV